MAIKMIETAQQTRDPVSTPTLSVENASILGKLSFNIPHTPTSANTSQHHFTEITTHPHQKGAVTLITTAIALVILTGGIMGAYYAASAGLGYAGIIGVITLLSLSTLASFYHYSLTDSQEQGAPPKTFVATPLLIPTCKTVQAQTEQHEEKTLKKKEEISPKNQTEKIKQFLLDNPLKYEQTCAQIDQKLRRTAAKLDHLKHFPEQTPEKENKLQAKFENLLKTQDYLKDVHYNFIHRDHSGQ